jgi:putative methyltransferase
MPTLHLPSPNTTPIPPASKGKGKGKSETPRRKRTSSSEPLDIIDDNGIITPVNSTNDLETRLAALSAFQLTLLLHAMNFPMAHKITYSTCSIHSVENEAVVTKALTSPIAKERGWRILKRDEQVRGMREWPIRGDREACADERGDEVAEACVRANKGDEHGTMGFFLAAFVRDRVVASDDRAAKVVRDEKGFIVRDLMGIPVMAYSDLEKEEEEEEWTGFGNDDEENERDMKSGGEEVEMRNDGEIYGNDDVTYERVEAEAIATELETTPHVVVVGDQADLAKGSKKRKRKTKKGK